METCKQGKKNQTRSLKIFVFLTCFPMPGRKCLCLTGRCCSCRLELLAWVGLHKCARASSGLFFVTCALLPRNIKCLLAMVISNDETNTGEFSIYKNSVK